MSAPPIPMMFTGDAFVPAGKALAAAREHYGAGKVVKLVEHLDRSMKSHDHFFVLVGDAFDNLPEAFDGRWATADHMRKWALIKANYRDERTHVCASHAEALRTAALVKSLDDYAITLANESVVTIYTAKSQSRKAMGAKVFQASKTAVLDILADLLSVPTQQLISQHRDPGSVKSRPGLAAA